VIINNEQFIFDKELLSEGIEILVKNLMSLKTLEKLFGWELVSHLEKLL
jgi:hypothetical protein